MSKPTNKNTLELVRRLYDEGQTMTQIGGAMNCSAAWVRRLLMKTGTTRPRGYNLKKVVK
jgi:hypothetical protein